MRSDRRMLVRGISAVSLVTAVGLWRGAEAEAVCQIRLRRGGVTMGWRGPPRCGPRSHRHSDCGGIPGSVTWSLSPASFGTLSNQTSTSVTYTAPLQWRMQLR